MIHCGSVDGNRGRGMRRGIARLVNQRAPRKYYQDCQGKPTEQHASLEARKSLHLFIHPRCHPPPSAVNKFTSDGRCKNWIWTSSSCALNKAFSVLRTVNMFAVPADI